MDNMQVFWNEERRQGLIERESNCPSTNWKRIENIQSQRSIKRGDASFLNWDNFGD